MAQDTVEINGFALRFARQSRGRATAELAAALNCDRSYIARIELGHAKRVSELFYNRLLQELVIKDYRVLLANPHAVELQASA